jgi:hypothetical protein
MVIRIARHADPADWLVEVLAIPANSFPRRTRGWENQMACR